MSGAAIIGALRAVFGADTAAFEDGIDRVHREMKRTERSFKKFGDKLNGIGKTLSIGITAPIAALGVASMKTASDMAELDGAFDVTFGNASDSVRKWAEVTGDALGRSTKEIQESAVAFQSLFGKALDPESATELTKQFSVLTQDLASFKNLSNEVAQQKLFSGLTGEAEPLRAVGVFINEAAVTAKALEIGLEKVNGKFTDQQKIVARAALIQEQLSDANGDVIRTFDNTANQVKRAQAAFEELRVTIGTQLLPVVTPLIEKIADALTWFGSLPEPVVNTSLAIAGVAAAIGPVLAAVGSMITLLAPLLAGLVAVTGATTTLGAVMTIALGPIGLAVAAVVALTVAYESAGEAARNTEKAIETANEKINSYIQTSQQLESDTKLLKTKTDELNKSIKGSGTAAQDAARLEIDAIRQRIAKNKELQRIYLDDAKLQLQKAEETAARADNKQLVKLTGFFEDKSKAYGRLRKGEEGYREALEERFTLELNGLRASIDGGETLSKKERKRFEDLNNYFLERENRAQSVLEIEERIAALAKDGAKFTAASPGGTVEPPKPAAVTTKKKKGKTPAQKIREEIEANKQLVEALKISEREYEITNETISLMQSGFKGTKEEARALSIELVDGSEAMDAVRAKTEAVTKAREDAAEGVRKLIEAHQTAKQSYAEELESNTKLAAALKISSKEYRIVSEQMRIMAADQLMTADGARQMAEALVKSRDELDKIGDATRKLEADLAKTGKTGVDAFTDTANSFTGLLNSIKGGDLEGILSGIFGVLESIGLFGKGGSTSAGGSSGGGFGAILGGIAGIFGGFKADGGPVKSGITYMVGERGPELFTPPSSGRIVPNHEMNGGKVQVLVSANEYFDARVDERAAGVAEPISQVSTVQGVQQYNASAQKRNRQRLR